MNSRKFEINKFDIVLSAIENSLLHYRFSISVSVSDIVLQIFHPLARDIYNDEESEFSKIIRVNKFIVSQQLKKILDPDGPWSIIGFPRDERAREMEK